MSIPQVDGLSTDPQEIGRHIMRVSTLSINGITDLEKDTSIILQLSVLRIISRRVLNKVGHTNTPQVEVACFTPI